MKIKFSVPAAERLELATGNDVHGSKETVTFYRAIVTASLNTGTGWSEGATRVFEAHGDTDRKARREALAKAMRWAEEFVG